MGVWLEENVSGGQETKPSYAHHWPSCLQLYIEHKTKGGPTMCHEIQSCAQTWSQKPMTIIITLVALTNHY